MKYSAVLPVLASTVAAQMTHTVVVGGVTPQATGAATPILGFSPESVTAAQGDIVEFHFMQKNHSATQSSFANPCVKAENGHDSGFMPNPDGKAGVTFSITVSTTTPIWMFCQQTGHCGKGMVFAINAPTTGDKTFQAYKQLAINQNGANLQSANIAAATPPAQTAATVTVEATSGNGALSSQATVVPGSGTTSDGQACDCSCLCGTNSFPPNVALGSFGGFVGMMGS